uniref:WLM domain-containing protein n=1 Tax=viral metagenome TaxID=1070528 RepID=A0A6C0EPI0_9ZZZZ
MIPAALLTAGVALALASTRGVKNVVEIQSTKDGKVYRVQNLPDKQEACERIADICEKLTKLIENYKSDPSAMGDPRIKVLVSRFNPNNFSENDITADTTSYSENKGEKIVVCIRDKVPPYRFADENTVMFVLLHEMAHLMTTTVGHTPEFWTNFKRILQDAVQCGIYTPVNYSKMPTPYCGMHITDSPI